MHVIAFASSHFVVSAVFRFTNYSGNSEYACLSWKLNLDSPRFSIVIPTRNRPKAVVSTIRTCLNQDYDNYEIIVSDNCSTPETFEAVASISSPKIHYFRSDKPLSLSNSWEFAISHARGEFVTLLGDDDGLLFHALVCADELIRELKTKLLRWDYVLYNWSKSLDVAARNLIRTWINGVNEMADAKNVVPPILYEKQCHWALPMIYNSFCCTQRFAH